jgi:hypothetical protein
MGDKFKQKRQEAMSSAFKAAYGSEKIDGPSMGCKVAAPVCSICGDAVEPCEHVENIVKYTPEEQLAGVRFISAALVKAPQCETCGEAMEYTGEATRWVCENDSCTEKGVAVETGIGGLVTSVE